MLDEGSWDSVTKDIMNGVAEFMDPMYLQPYLLSPMILQVKTLSPKYGTL